MNDIKSYETVRIIFSKYGKVKYISHLDLNRAMTRAIRRTTLPIWYTEGFNKHPYITFVAPLSLGMESVCERMDFRLCEEVPYDVIVEEFNKELPEGLKVLSAGPVVEKAGKLGFARYKISLPCKKKNIEEFLAKDSIIVEKRTKKGQMKEIDIKPAIQDCEILETEKGCEWSVTLPCNSTDTVNPSLVLMAISEKVNVDDAKVCRLELFDLDKNVFQ